MSELDKARVRDIYKRYGFTESSSKDSGVMVFTIRSGHFHNADIVPVTKCGDFEQVFLEFKNSGYACKVRRYVSIEDVERQLFLGFFSAESTKSRLKKEYDRFAKSIMSLYGSDACYAYVNTKYTINGSLGDKTVVDEVKDRIESSKPVLFLIEAAAGYGKTCTAYEVMKSIVTGFVNKVPLFTEFSRNRQAKIFRYVLLDEIDRSFPVLRSSLVTAEIKRGNVPLILDGFDELLRSKADEGFEVVEPMLETIGELLKEKAKIILTTRRTAIFNGDEFHGWIGDHQGDFELIRIRLSEPQISDWLDARRLRLLEEVSVPVERIENPVLLSYLKYINDIQFSEVIKYPDKIVEKYFDVMFERETERQNLSMSADQQAEVMRSIARDMMLMNYTSESKDYISDYIVKTHDSLLDSVRRLYSSEERPTKDELATKLASHAFLDKSSDDEQQIGFVNEFIMGNFCAEVICKDSSGEWLCEERYVEPSIVAYLPRSEDRRRDLLRALGFMFNFISPSDKAKYYLMLSGGIDYELDDVSIERVEFKNIFLGGRKIRNTVFFSCIFSDVHFNIENMLEVSFIECRFYGSSAGGEGSQDAVRVYGGYGSDEIFVRAVEKEGGIIDVEKEVACEAHILETFFPVGSASAFKHRPLKVLLTKTGCFSYSDCYDAVSRLRKKGILCDANSHGIVEIDFSKRDEIQNILGSIQ